MPARVHPNPRCAQPLMVLLGPSFVQAVTLMLEKAVHAGSLGIFHLNRPLEHYIRRGRAPSFEQHTKDKSKSKSKSKRRATPLHGLRP